MQIGQDGETLTADFYTRATKSLNVMLKTWEAQGIHLWTMQEGVLFLRVAQSEYPFGDSSTKIANTYYETESSVAVVAGSVVIPVESTVGIANGYNVGVVNSDNDLQWSTVVSFVANTSITLNDPLLVGINVNAVVYYYSTTDFKPCLRVLDVRRKESDDYEVPINLISRQEYFSLPNKNSQGYPVQAYYSREEPDGIMYIWNAPSSSVPVIRFTYERKLQIMTQAEQTFDVPEYWYEAIIYNLASRLAITYGCAPTRLQLIAGMARQTLSDALGYDTDLYPIKLTMNQQ